MTPQRVKRAQDAAAHPDAATVRALAVYARVATAGAGALGLATLVGWVVNVPTLKQVLPGTVSMKANTALAGILLAGAIALLPARTPALQWSARALAAIVTLVGILTTLEWATGQRLGLDEALFRDDTTGTLTAVPGRMSILTELAFATLGAATLLRATTSTGRPERDSQRRRASDALAATAGFVGFASTLGYAYGTAIFSTAAGYTAVAPTTGIMILLASSALLTTAVERGLLARVAARSPGGRVLRTAAPAALVIGVLIGSGGLFGQRALALDLATTTTLQVALALAAMVLTLGVIAERLDHHDAVRRRATAEVQQRTRDLEASTRELETFSYSVSHDLRAPLRALDGFSVALQEDAGDSLSDAAREDLRRIREASARMSALIDDMLVLSRVSRAELHPRDVDVTLRARTIGDELSREHPERRVTLDVAPGLHASADPPLLDALLRNLLENAWKFTSRRPDDARVTVGVESRGDGNAAFFVRDNGVGFDPRFIGKLFQPFQRLHGKSEFPGNGIGLATVARIVARHGGAAWAQGALDRGATFYFTLPQKANA